MDFESRTETTATNTTTGTTSSTFYTYRCKPPCFRSKCDCCEWKDRCANANKDCIKYVPCYPYYPQVTYTWDGRTTSGSLYNP